MKVGEQLHGGSGGGLEKAQSVGGSMLRTWSLPKRKRDLKRKKEKKEGSTSFYFSNSEGSGSVELCPG